MDQGANRLLQEEGNDLVGPVMTQDTTRLLQDKGMIV